MAEHELEKLLGGFAADTLTPEEKQRLYQAALQDQQLFDALADEQALKELLTDPTVRRRLLHALRETSPARGGSPATWLDWFRRPANLALAGGLATAVFAVVLGTKIYQDSVQQAARSAATEAPPPATPQLPAAVATRPAPSPTTESKTRSKETDSPAPPVSKKDALTDKSATGTVAGPSQPQDYRPADAAQEPSPQTSRQEDARKQPETPVATSPDRQPAAGAPGAAPEAKIAQAPARAAAPVADTQPASARALFYGETVRADSDRKIQNNERAMNAPAESEAPSNLFKRKLEGLSQLSKAAGSATPGKPLGLRYSFVVQNSDGQEQEVDAASAASTTPVHITLEPNQDGYIQVWRNVGEANTQLLLPLKETGRISMKIQAGQRQRLPLPADSGTVVVRLSPVPFGPISRQEAALLTRRSPALIQESVSSSHPSGSPERATYVVSQDPSPTAEITVDITGNRQ